MSRGNGVYPADEQGKDPLNKCKAHIIHLPITVHA